LKISRTPLESLLAIEPEKHFDERGFFARTFCAREFSQHGVTISFVQCGTSFNTNAGTVRGMHFQKQPYSEAKLIRCTRGALLDTIIDIREGSATYLKSFSIELSQNNGRLLFVPEGFAHGYQTLVNETEVFYEISSYYNPQAATGLRWDDPALDITWPLPVSVITQRDRTWPLIGTMSRSIP